ncbi:10411_t:CDS:2, partial [Gigaspora margarita]
SSHSSILDFLIDTPCTLLDMPFLPFVPHSKHNCPLVNLSDFRDGNSSHYSLDHANFLSSILLTSLCPIVLASSMSIPIQIKVVNLITWYLFLDYSTVKAGNTYLQESNTQPDPRRYITISSEAKSLPVSDLFDYIYEE